MRRRPITSVERGSSPLDLAKSCSCASHAADHRPRWSSPSSPCSSPSAGPPRPRSADRRRPAPQGTVTGQAIKNGTVTKADLTKGAVRSLTATPARRWARRRSSTARSSLPTWAPASWARRSSPPARDRLEARPGLDRRWFGGERFPADGRHRLVHGIVRSTSWRSTHEPARRPSAASPAGGQPNIADDVVVVTPPASWPDPHRHRQAGPGNTIRIIACWTGDAGCLPPDTRPDALSLRDLRRALSQSAGSYRLHTKLPGGSEQDPRRSSACSDPPTLP